MFPGCGVALLPARPVDLRAQGEGVVEYPGKVACPSGRRCSTRNAVWCHSHPGFKSQRYRHCRPAPLGPGGFVMPTWRVVLPCAVWPRWCSGRRRARPPARLGGLTSFGAAPRSPPVPSGPSGALHTSGACRCEWSAWPGLATAHRHRSLALRSLRRPPHQWCQVSDVARCVGLLFGQAPPPPVGVTGVSCVEFLGWSGVCCYKRRQSDGFLAENGRYRSVRAMTSRKSRM